MSGAPTQRGKMRGAGGGQEGKRRGTKWVGVEAATIGETDTGLVREAHKDCKSWVSWGSRAGGFHHEQVPLILSEFGCASYSPENLGGFCFAGALHIFQNLQRLISCSVEDLYGTLSTPTPRPFPNTHRRRPPRRSKVVNMTFILPKVSRSFAPRRYIHSFKTQLQSDWMLCATCHRHRLLPELKV